MHIMTSPEHQQSSKEWKETSQDSELKKGTIEKMCMLNGL